MTEQVDMDVKELADAGTATTEASTEGNNTSTDNSEDDELVLDFEEPEESAQGDATDSEASTAPEKGASETTESEEKSTRAEERKMKLNNEIRDKVAERNALREEIAKLNQQKYQLQKAEDLPTVEALMEQQNPDTGDYYTRMEAELARIKAERALEKEQQQLNEYTERIVDNRIRLKDEASQALKDFPMFDEKSDAYNEELAEQANQIADGLLIRDDKTGEIIGSHGSIYTVYAAIANAAKSAEASGKLAGRQAAVDMMNSADVVGSSGTTTTDADDPFLSGLLS